VSFTGGTPISGNYFSPARIGGLSGKRCPSREASADQVGRLRLLLTACPLDSRLVVEFVVDLEWRRLPQPSRSTSHGALTSVRPPPRSRAEPAEPDLVHRQVVPEHPEDTARFEVRLGRRRHDHDRVAVLVDVEPRAHLTASPALFREQAPQRIGPRDRARSSPGPDRRYPAQRPFICRRVLHHPPPRALFGDVAAGLDAELRDQLRVLHPHGLGRRALPEGRHAHRSYVVWQNHNRFSRI
jgi:hypothetical protein